jgi:excinuclease ABC subunit A
MFSFNSPYGACPTCDGLGVVSRDDGKSAESSETTGRVDPAEGSQTCSDCRGTRLNHFASGVTFGSLTLPALTAMTVDEAIDALWIGIEQETTEATEGPSANSARADAAPLSPEGGEVARRVLPEILGRLGFLSQVGLGYLTLDRPTRTLSGGEFQRSRLAGCLGSGLTGVCYILDEPTIGLHPRDTRRLIDTLAALRDQGNTVVVVEHDVDVIRAADHVVDIGPGAGPDGGRVVVTGTPAEIANHADSMTGRYLGVRSAASNSAGSAPRDVEQPSSGRIEICGPAPTPLTQRSLFADDQPSLTLSGVRTHNLRGVTVEFPLARLVCVTGVSGSGKSSLITHSLIPAVRRALAAETGELDQPTPTVAAIQGVEHIARLVEIDQSPLGRSGRSNPATYSGLWDEVRKVFAKTREARLRGFTARRFSFNSRDGRCETCRGQGTRRIRMHYMPDMFVTCPACRGARFNRATLAVRFRGRNVADVLAMRFDEAAAFFDQFARVRERLQVFVDVGLGYLTLGQSSLHLSGGEAQRGKLATELSRPGADRALFVLDEPTTGLHPADVERLLTVLRRLVARGDSVIVIEHQLQLIAAADWLIDLGPEAGAAGGQIIASGPPAEIAASGAGSTAVALRDVLA